MKKSNYPEKKKLRTKYLATIYAILAAALYAINVPLSKILLNYVEPTMMASFLYLGAGLGLFIYGQVISKRLWFAIVLVTIASIVLSFEGAGSFVLNQGSLFVIGACLCWGFENNCTKMISNKSSIEIVVIKGTFYGLGSLIVALILGEEIPDIPWLISVLVLGFVAYGLSIHFYIMAQKDLGAAKTSAYYSIAPFLGVAFSMLLLKERPSIQFYVALIIMIVSIYFMVKDTIELQHTHEHEHEHCA